MQAIETAGRKLLVLDDDVDVSFTICTIARNAGFDTKACEHASEFFVCVSEWEPSHIIVDLSLPDCDGVETLRYLAEARNTGIIIVMSGLGSRVLEAAGRAAAEEGLQVAGVLAKPFNPSQLRKLLEIGPSLGALYTPRRGSAAVHQEIGVDELAAGLAAREFRVFCQPKIACGKGGGTVGTVVGFECLARWHRPGIGLVAPDRFIPLAERSGQINELTVQIIETALSWFGSRFRDTELQLALNISPKVLANPLFPNWVLEQCAHEGLRPDQIILEITETSTLHDPLPTLELLTQFRIKGFRLSIDDFGVGYSSLVQLARLPYSEMKIDKSFIISAPHLKESRTIAAAIVGLAHGLGLFVTAEGVEDQWTLEFLCEIGCDFAQGYHISRPMDALAIEDWLHEYQHKA